jgi:hypothetical protein
MILAAWLICLALAGTAVRCHSGGSFINRSCDLRPARVPDLSAPRPAHDMGAGVKDLRQSLAVDPVIALSLARRR